MPYTKPDTYFDSKGRRRVDRDHSHQDHRSDGQAATDQLRQDLHALQDAVDNMRINGVGFSGQGPRGIRFDEDQLSGGGGGGQGGTPFTGVLLFANGAFYSADILVAGEPEPYTP